MPRYEDIDWRGLGDFTPERFYEMMSVERGEWSDEVLRHEELFIKLYDRLPKELRSVRDLLMSSSCACDQDAGRRRKPGASGRQTLPRAPRPYRPT
jgi:hypothetical protein